MYSAFLTVRYLDSYSLLLVALSYSVYITYLHVQGNTICGSLKDFHLRLTAVKDIYGRTTLFSSAVLIWMSGDKGQIAPSWNLNQMCLCSFFQGSFGSLPDSVPLPSSFLRSPSTQSLATRFRRTLRLEVCISLIQDHPKHMVCL